QFVQQFIKEVEEVTNGDVQVTSYPGSSLAAPDEQFDAASTGAVDFSLSVHSYNPNQFPLTSVMELPFMSEDRKSTRLNSSHVSISYAVFCLKKKNKIYKTHLLK